VRPLRFPGDNVAPDLAAFADRATMAPM
jgi:hypothetical protein